MNDLAIIAKAAGVRQADLLALAPNNDPYSLHRPARRRAAEWFADLWHRFGFGHGVHIRRIHYRIVSAETPVMRPDRREAYLNTTSCWKLLGDASRDARYLDLVPADAIVDRRSPPPIEHFNTQQAGDLQLRDHGLYLAEPDPDFPDLPSLGLDGANYGPPVLVEIWAEKTTMNDTLLPLARRYGVNLITGVGEMSVTSTRLFLERVRASERPARILYISDFDPGGRSMPVAVARKVEFALHKSGEDLDITLDPLVLTEDQCREWNLPRTPIKETERRGAKFEERFGEGATELDALEALHPGALGRIVSEGVERHIDPDHKRQFDLAVQEHRQKLAGISYEVQEAHDEDVDALRAEYDQMVNAFARWRSRADRVFERIADDLREVDVPEFEPPEPLPRPPAPEPMFDAGRSYLEQLEAYHRWQGRGV